MVMVTVVEKLRKLGLELTSRGGEKTKKLWSWSWLSSKGAECLAERQKLLWMRKLLQLEPNSKDVQKGKTLWLDLELTSKDGQILEEETQQPTM